MEIIKDTKKEKIYNFTYLSFVDYAKNRKKSKTAIAKNCNSSREISNSITKFSGIKNIEEAFKLAENGWDAGIEQLDLEDGILVNGNGIEVNENVHGSMVNVGNYLQGLPNNMYEFTEVREYKLEPLTIYVPLSYSVRVSVKQAMNFAKSIIDIVNKNQSKHNVKIVGVFYCKFKRSNGINLIHNVIIKDFDERFVINNIAFSFHPSFFRRIDLSVIEAEEFMDSGYGSIQPQSELWDYFKKIRKGKSMLFPALGSLSGDGAFSENKTLILE